jgi:hypothetical protein
VIHIQERSRITYNFPQHCCEPHTTFPQHCCESHTSARGPIPSSSLASKRVGENSWRCISDTHTILLNIVVNHIQFPQHCCESHKTFPQHCCESHKTFPIIPNFLFKRSSDPSKFPAQNQRLLVRCGDVPTDTRDASALVRSRPLQFFTWIMAHHETHHDTLILNMSSPTT